MTGYLLLIALGPVQDFIAQARRTRDLWYGSHLLSELSRAAARVLAGAGAELVFPALESGDDELQACSSPIRHETGLPPLSVANKLLAELPEGKSIDPAKLARMVRAAVYQHWRELSHEVRERCRSLLAADINAAWDEQVDTCLEFTASWAPLPVQGYAHARREVEAAVSARKNLRDFSVWHKTRGAVPKSSLDGARETVLAPPRARSTALERKYRIASGEQLDAIGLVKRAGGEPDQFVPIVNVALASWCAKAQEHASGALESLRAACREIRITSVNRSDLGWVKAFPFDASILLRSRWPGVFQEQGLEGVDPQAWGRKHLRPLYRALSDPYPYVACLVADGDRMGATIDRLSHADQHRVFSRQLATFATDARRIVEHEHCGSLVYAGGDDVLAFLPLPEALSCADALRHCFAEIMRTACGSHVVPPTLSVGLGIGHVMDGMGDLLSLGRQAERTAKGTDRNALAVRVDKRSGGMRSWRAGWHEWDQDPVGRLRADADLLADDTLSMRKVYQVAKAILVFPHPEVVSDQRWTRVLVMEVHRILARTQGEAPIGPADVGLVMEESQGYRVVHGALRSWIERMLVARTFAQAAPRVRAGSAGREAA